jgi:signal transduction histidine kinase
LIVVGAMAGIVAVPVIGIAYFRVAGNILGWAETAWLVVWLAIVSAGVLGFLLWRLVLQPVTALTAHARAVRAGRRDAPLPDHFGTPEFSDLGQSVIDMGETLNNRADSLRAYANHVTHELKSPLTAIAGAAELLQGKVDEDDRAALARTIRQATGRMEHLLSDLGRHAAAGIGTRTGTADLAEVAGRVDGIALQVVQGGSVPMPPEDLRAVLAQLAQNAATQGADRLQLTWDGAVLQIEDNGQGVAQGNRDRIFDPFFTTTRATGGTGMGLAIVRALVEAQGGKIALVETSRGARFDIVF